MSTHPSFSTTANAEPELLRVPEAAHRYGVSVSTIRAWIRREWIPSVKFSRKCVRIPRRKADAVLAGRHE